MCAAAGCPGRGRGAFLGQCRTVEQGRWRRGLEALPAPTERQRPRILGLGAARTDYREHVRLGFCIPILDERPAGLGVYVEEVCSRLARLHPDFVVFTGTPGVARPWFQPSQVRPLGGRLAPWLKGLEGPRRRVRRMRWWVAGAARELPAEGVDVLFSPVQEAPLRSEVPTVVVMHDVTALRFPEAFGRLAVAQTRWVLPLMLQKAAAVVAVSENTRRDILQTFGVPQEKVTVVGEGYDRGVFRRRSEEEIAAAKRTHGVHGRYLLYAGTFSRHKNLGLVARALARLSAHADLSFVLVGRKDAGALTEFEAVVREVGLASRVVLAGYVPRDELAALMSGAAAFVYPSRYEGFGLAPLEAMACGAPVVASAAASLPEVVGGGGVLVREFDEVSWSEALRRVLEGSRAELSDAAVRQAGRFDWEDAVERLSATLVKVALRRAR